VLNELLWFLKGNPNIDFLHEHNNHIWDEWVKDDGTFGPIYGKQWRSWDISDPFDVGLPHVRSIDQIQNVIDRLKTDPDNRRLIVSAWNVTDVEGGEMALPPCHVMFQFYTRPLTKQERWEIMFERDQDFASDCRGSADLEELLDNWEIPTRALSCQLYQRSADTFLGVPFNIASYALLTHMIAHLVNMVPDEFIWTGGDTHIYHNHFAQVLELLGRSPDKYALPKLHIVGDVANIDDYSMDSFELVGYKHQGSIKAPVAV